MRELSSEDVMAIAWADLERQASDEAVALARTVLEQDVADRAWAEQVGPALSQRDVARLLGKSEQAVSKDRRLLRVRNRDGRPVYPILQFRGRSQLAGVATIVELLSQVAQPVTITAWLTGSLDAIDGQRPIDALRQGDGDTLAAVLTAAARFAERSVA